MPRETPTSCSGCPLRQNPNYRNFTGGELAFVEALKVGERRFARGEDIFVPGQSLGHVYTILTGWALRYDTLSDGRRQVLNFLLPGDLTGLQQALDMPSEYGVQAVSDVTTCMFPVRRLPELYERFPGLGFDITWMCAQEERLVDMNLVSAGRRNGLEKVAYILLTLFDRQQVREAVIDGSCECPVTQEMLGDALGLTVVHTNRMLQQIRQTGLAELRGGRLTIFDREALADLAKLDTSRHQQVPRPFI